MKDLGETIKETCLRFLLVAPKVKPQKTLRQKDRILTKLWRVLDTQEAIFCKKENLSGKITEANCLRNSSLFVFRNSIDIGLKEGSFTNE